jgi:hypothetical protein
LWFQGHQTKFQVLILEDVISTILKNVDFIFVLIPLFLRME